MGKQVNKLSARAVGTLAKPGRHSDGGGLYLNVTESGAKSWLFMYKIAGRRREMGLGSARDVPLARARELASENRQHLHSGRDPFTVRAKPQTMTFADAAEALLESMSPSWRNAKHRAQWAMTLRVYGVAFKAPGERRGRGGRAARPAAAVGHKGGDCLQAPGAH